MLNHSCLPNATAVFVGSTIHIASLRRILAGEEICISYAYDLRAPVLVRVRFLLGQYNFWCECEACADGIELESSQHLMMGDDDAPVGVQEAVGQLDTLEQGQNLTYF
jgi:hypothetical protein